MADRPMVSFLFHFCVFISTEKFACLKLSRVLETFMLRTYGLYGNVSLFFFPPVGPHLFLYSIEKETTGLMRATVMYVRMNARFSFL